MIYDLGGGTFDASLLKMTGHINDVVRSEGIQRLGGDDFDEAILQLVAARLPEIAELAATDVTGYDVLREECAARKEAVGPQTRRFLMDLTGIGATGHHFPAISMTCIPHVRRWSTIRSGTVARLA
ncbi:hsp70 family protein [Mycobacterium ulcerans str. Harvey]|uniref:Hsp70 family protein n=1 Tax=Mycobacterium ulcerans str. Harvey TaxID=1299332 RepID=A0ABP3A309_MYCUL|nr:hsp70 family protein [Mycobacterium ulcerans str. Harvey]